MDIMNIAEHKRWASELSDQEFWHEFQRRYPLSDNIPDKSEWLSVPEPINPMIDGVKPDDIMVNDYEPKKKMADRVYNSVSIDKPLKKEYFCRGEGCDRVFTAYIGQVAHERRCSKALNTKL